MYSADEDQVVVFLRTAYKELNVGKTLSPNIEKSEHHHTSCIDCHACSGGHQCIKCNEGHSTIEALIEHQKKRQQFGGHFILSTPRTKVRRQTIRFRNDIE